MARFLVTGGGGFIGSNLVAALVARGDQVRVLDDFSTGRRQNLDGLSGVDLVVGDLRDLDTVRRAMAGVDFVLHQGALPSVQRSVEDPVTSNQVNIGGTLNVLVAARDAGVARVVYAASSSAYGDTPTLPKREDMPPTPLSPYALQKLAGEQYMRVFHSLFGLETVALRYFNVFGPRQDPKSDYAAVIPRFIMKIQRGEAPTIFGDGEQTRDFCFIENVVQANLAACTAPAAAGHVMNIGGGKRISLNQLVETICQITGKTCEAVYTAPRPGDVRHSLADVGRARELIGYEPRFDVTEGLRRTVEYFASHQSP
ncbi:MAG: SDR family oxidoreductase [Deltaproteobacteria bacterium]|nr:SDR family oxidoreductase [Deltaproteobacteria bacterium]